MTEPTPSSMETGSFDEIIYCKLVADNCAVVLTKEVNGLALFYQEGDVTYLLSFFSHCRRDEAVETAVATAQFKPEAIRSDALALV